VFGNLTRELLLEPEVDIICIYIYIYI
jgi:hypothetical protein